LESQGQPKLFEGVNNFFPNVLLQLPPTIWIIHIKKKIFKFQFQTPYISIMVIEIEFNR
jgi:hypothetical protein